MNEVNVQAFSGTMPIFPTLIYKDLPRPDNYHPIQKEVKSALVNIQSSNDYGEVSYLHPEARKQKSVNKNDSMYLIKYDLIGKYNLVNLKQRIIETTTNYVTSTMWSRLCGERWRVNIKNSWMNIQGKDRHHEWHCHPGYQVSGVYYMRVSPDQGGIQFLNPNNIIQSCNFPENTKTCPQSMEFIPCDGELILFPSWLMHNTCPNVTDEERISVAFNIDLEIE